VGELEESKECMKMAIRHCPNAGNADNIIHTLPLIHMSQRDWFDDDDVNANPLALLRPTPPEELDAFDEEDDSISDYRDRNTDEYVDADPLFLNSLRTNISKMKLAELTNALKMRGVKSHGSKKELQNRLFRSLMSDAGLAP